MHGQFKPADHSKGDANTLGGYMAVHDRPAAFEGPDGFSYSVEILTDRTGEAAAPIGAFLLFVQWARIGAASPQGHLESDFLARGTDEAEVRARAGAMGLAEVKALLDQLVAARDGARPARRWWDAMRADDPAHDA
ncbi:MAG TPA: hypothetical protein VG818_05735 [Gemmatimonadaceae bacterium]|jgi:hypothetical protein|nr:hypothetical protein [Gemmatimonadaceae bacterium]